MFTIIVIRFDESRKSIGPRWPYQSRKHFTPPISKVGIDDKPRSNG